MQNENEKVSWTIYFFSLNFLPFPRFTCGISLNMLLLVVDIHKILSDWQLVVFLAHRFQLECGFALLDVFSVCIFGVESSRLFWWRSYFVDRSLVPNLYKGGRQWVVRISEFYRKKNGNESSILEETVWATLRKTVKYLQGDRSMPCYIQVKLPAFCIFVVRVVM